MISERELRRTAGQLGLGVGQAEHEYAMLCTLDALAHTPFASEHFCLKGGTALRLGYFKDWRHSVDLDFTVLPAAKREQLPGEITKWFEQVEALHGVEIALRDYHAANGAVRMRARYLGPLRHPNRLLFDLTLDEPVILSPARRPVVIDLFAKLQPQVLMYQLEEILAEKMRSILQRGKARDYYDVWRLLGEKGNMLNLPLMRQVLEQKCRHKAMDAPLPEDFFQLRLLEAASVYWTQDLSGQTQEGALPAWEEVIAELQPLLESLLN